MPRGRGGRGGGRVRGGYDNWEDIAGELPYYEEEAAFQDRIVYARVEHVAKKGEFVLDFPDLDEYLSVPFAANDPNADYYYEPIQQGIFSHFNANGIMGYYSLH